MPIYAHKKKNPLKAHWKVVKINLHYLASSVDHVLHLRGLVMQIGQLIIMIEDQQHVIMYI